MSEIAHLKQQIALECEAMRSGLSGYAATARHEQIEARTRRMESYQRRLAELVGQESALDVVTQTYMCVMEGAPG